MLAPQALDADGERTLRRIQRNAVASIVLFSLGAIAWGPSFLLGVVSGGLIALLGFAGLARMVTRLTGDRPRGFSWLSLLGVLFRYILLALALFVIIGVWRANVVAVALGFSAPVAALFVEAGLRIYWELRSRT